MKKFFEGLKDILYDGIDYIMMVIVIVVVALVINWRLGGLFTTDAVKPPPGEPSNSVDSENITSDDEKAENTEGVDENSDENQESIIDSGQQDELAENESREIVKISIPAGSLPTEIGGILESNGLVDDKNEFVKKSVELNMETKLKSGEFEISKDSSLEEIIRIIAK